MGSLSTETRLDRPKKIKVKDEGQEINMKMALFKNHRPVARRMRWLSLIY